VEVVNVIENENKLIVFKGETMALNTAITQPFSIVKIPKTGKPIEFE